MRPVIDLVPQIASEWRCGALTQHEPVAGLVERPADRSERLAGSGGAEAAHVPEPGMRNLEQGRLRRARDDGDAITAADGFRAFGDVVGAGRAGRDDAEI